MKRYWPLIVIVAISVVAGIAMMRLSRFHSANNLMINISGFFFLFLATLKFWDLEGFNKSFLEYDLLAKHVPGYGYLYPFLELLIALGYLSYFFVLGMALLTFVLMLITFIGVLNALISGKKLNCACMGSKLDVPLSVVSLVETLGMGIMAVLIIVQIL